MESKIKFLGHPIHPILIVFPLGLFIVGFVFDILYLLTQTSTFATVAFYNIGAGVIGGLAAAIFGLWDWLAIPDGTRAKRIGLLHGLSNVIVVLLFGASWLLRFNAPNRLPTTTALVLEIVGIVLSAIAGWLGGEMVDRLGVGVDPGAHLNAPSSLSGQPADQGIQKTP